MAKDLQTFLREYEANFPDDFIHIEKEINSNQEASAILFQFEKQEKYPVLHFHNVINAYGKRAEQALVMNIFASRARLAWMCKSTLEAFGRDIYKATNEKKRKPIVISREEAPVKQIVKTGDKIDLFEYPAPIHNDMDAGHYISAGFIVTYDPDTGVDNSAIQRGWIYAKDKIRVGIKKSGHNGANLSKHEQRNREMKVAIWVGHHPLAYMGGLAKLPYPSSHWESIGGMLGEPLRLVPSESLGIDFLVPADAEFVVEGIVEANKRYTEAPFGEFTGCYGPQTLAPQMQVTAITHRRNAIWQSVGAGYTDHRALGAGSFEGLIWGELKPRFPSLQKVYMPLSGLGRYHVYLQFKEPGADAARQAITATLDLNLKHGFIKHVFAFDDDVDIYSPQEIMWAIATRSQWDKDIIILPNKKVEMADPSAGASGGGALGGMDCTKPWGEPFEVRNGIDKAIIEKIKLEDFISPERINKVKTEML